MGITQVHWTHAQTALYPFIQGMSMCQRLISGHECSDSFVQLQLHSQYCYTQELHIIPLHIYPIKLSFGFSSLCKLALSRLPWLKIPMHSNSGLTCLLFCRTLLKAYFLETPLYQEAQLQLQYYHLFEHQRIEMPHHTCLSTRHSLTSMHSQNLSLKPSCLNTWPC